MNEGSKYFDGEEDAEEKAIQVLLLDDNLMTSLRLRSNLQQLGCTVVVASSWPHQSTLIPQFVLINLGSRSMDGLELVRQAQSTLKSATIIGFCGHKEIEIRRAAKAAGVDRLLTNENVVEEMSKLLKSGA